MEMIPSNCTRIREDLFLFRSALYQMNTAVYLQDDQVWIVDPGILPQETKTIAQFVSRSKGQRACNLFLTHFDYDHILGWDLFPDSRIVASARARGVEQDAQSLRAVRSFEDELYWDKEAEFQLPAIDLAIPEKGLTLGEQPPYLHFFQTPGHTQDGAAMCVLPDGILFCGDYLSDLEFPWLNGSIRDYLLTLEEFEMLVHARKIHLLIPGHGNPAQSREEILGRIERDRIYLTRLRDGQDPDDLLQWALGCFPKFHSQLTKIHDHNRSWLTANPA